MMISRFENEGSAGPRYSQLRVEVNEFDPTSNEPALRIVVSSSCQASVVLCHSSACKLVAALVAEFPERRKTERRKA